ncbi:hypothetical protein BHYA_0199g00130 [Botrytis hyacinthi]|uniref:Fungal N-terminal domain-containing protein n=1 Tax=Botrytis hyacinthi TaxID=278943 RepID=A0A4Z1GGY3_9HELO|nr:hypothetical protein BHYA_0199g00130 [Botrytis hyacinthi]
MADVLGTAVGVVSLGLQVSQGIVSYYSAYRDQAEEIDGIAQRTQALHTTLKHLQESLGSFRSNHTSAVALVAATVASCADNIRTLQTTLQKCQLSVPIGTGEKICFLGKKAIFPFRQATLQRLENIVGKLQANVDMAIMALQLEVSCKISEQTSSIVTTSAITTAGIDFITKELQSLNASFTHIDAILPTLKDVMDRHLQHDIRSRSLNQYMVQELSNVRMALQDVPEIVEQATSRALNSDQNQLAATVDNTSSKALVPDSDERAFKTLIRKVAKNKCPCQSQALLEGKHSYWSFSTRSLQILRSRTNSGCCRLDCPSRSHFERKNTWELTYSHCSRLFSGILRARLCIISTAGSLLSISPNLTFRRIVSSKSPVFKLMNDIRGRAYKVDSIGVSLDMDNITIQIGKMLANGQASLTDVNRRGESILHMACLIAEDLELTNAEVFQSYKRFLRFLAANTPGTMVNDTNTNGERPLEILFGSKVLGYYHPEVPDLCLELIDSMGLELSDSWLENQLIVSGCQWWDNYCRHLAMSLSSFRDVPEILGFHCGALSSTILQRSEDRMLQVLANFPDSAYERNTMGQTPLHLSSDWPIGISHLLRIGGQSLVNKQDCMGYLPVAYALYSKCLPAVELLLNADSPLHSFRADTINDTLKDVVFFRAEDVFLDALRSSSKDVINCMINSLVDRRNRLGQLAFQSLPTSKTDRLAISGDQVLDLHASSTCALLKVFGVDIPPALQIPEEYESIYHLLFVYDIYLREYAIPRVEIADMFYNAGFREIEEYHCFDSKRTLLMLTWTDHDTSPSEMMDKFKLLWWLIQKGADLHRVKRILQGDRRIPWSPATHFIVASLLIKDLWVITMEEINLLPNGGPENLSSQPEVRNVMFKVLTTSKADPCICACSKSGCTALTILLKQTTLELDEEEIISVFTDLSEEGFSLDSTYWIMRASIMFLLQVIGTDNDAWKILAPEIIRFATFTILELTHTCCVYYPYSEGSPPHHFTPFDIGDHQDIQEEESSQIEELELLVQDFESKYIELSQPILKFFDGYWRSCMLDYDIINTKPYTHDELEKIRELGVRI